MAQKLDSSQLIMTDFQYILATHRNAENNNLFVPYWFGNSLVYD